MKIEKVKISELKFADYNPRQMTKKQYEDLKESISRFGVVDPLIINNDNTIIGGHQRCRIMKEYGREFAYVVRLDLSKQAEKELNIRLNKNQGKWDMNLLANFEVQDLKDWGFKEIELGFNIDKIEEEPKEILVEIKEDDISRAVEIHRELKERGYNVTIK
jgi:ParB-like chromosome segregation protein Spo0J